MKIRMYLTKTILNHQTNDFKPTHSFSLLSAAPRGVSPLTGVSEALYAQPLQPLLAPSEEFIVCCEAGHGRKELGVLEAEVTCL